MLWNVVEEKINKKGKDCDYKFLPKKSFTDAYWFFLDEKLKKCHSLRREQKIVGEVNEWKNGIPCLRNILITYKFEKIAPFSWMFGEVFVQMYRGWFDKRILKNL